MRALVLVLALLAGAASADDYPRMRCAACALLPTGATASDLTLKAASGSPDCVLSNPSGGSVKVTGGCSFWTLSDQGVYFDTAGSKRIYYNSTNTQMQANGALASESGSGSNAFAVLTNGARFDFGTGANDYASSDGTTVTFAGPVTVGGLSAAAGSFTVNSVSGTSAISSGNALAFASKAVINTAPTLPVACTSPTIAASNGTAAFKIGVGSACATGTVSWTMPAATTGWSCRCENQVTDRQLHCKSTSTTAVSCVQYTVAGVAQNFAASDTLECECTGY
jgi:hypothetical protein